MFTHSGDIYALDELKSEAFSGVFQNRVPEPPMDSRNALSQAEVALNR